jgi:hypothetical protein
MFGLNFKKKLWPCQSASPRPSRRLQGGAQLTEFRLIGHALAMPPVQVVGQVLDRIEQGVG